MRDIGLLKNERSLGKFTEIRSICSSAAVAGDGIGPLLIRQKHEQIWFARKFGRLRAKSRRERQRSRAGSRQLAKRST